MKTRVLLLLGFALSLSVFAEEPLDCDNARTTLDINHCMYLELVAAEAVLEEYFATSVERYADDDVSVASMKKGQEAWLGYRSSHCDAVYDTWRDGTIRTAMALRCKLELTHQRTWVIWSDFLTYMDSTPPVLPEPSFRR